MWTHLYIRRHHGEGILDRDLAGSMAGSSKRLEQIAIIQRNDARIAGKAFLSWMFRIMSNSRSP